MVGFDILDSTSLADAGHRGTNGLQTITVNLDLFLSYGVGEIETLLAAIVAAGGCSMVVSPSGLTEGPSNPEYTLTNLTLDAAPVIMSTVGTLAVASVSFTNGTWVRDIV
jgi:hypothetical protein